LDNWIVDIHKQIDQNNKLFESFQLKLIEKEQERLTMQIGNVVDAMCDTNDLMQMVDVTCDTNDLMKMLIL
jgi:hypothetical protein